MRLYPHQLASVAFHVKHEYSMNGSDLGTGKTAIALEFIRQTGLPALIVGPAFLAGVWRMEAANLGVTDYIYVPYSQVHKLKGDVLNRYGVWVAEELHYIKSPTARRTQAYYSLLKKVRPRYWLGLSATVMRNRVPDLWVPLAICSQSPNRTNGRHLTDELTKYRGFSRHFCNVEILMMRGARIEKFTGVKEARLPELKQLLEDKYIRFKIADVVHDLPTLTRKEVELALRPVPGLEETFKAYCEGSKIDPTSKAASALLKAPHTAEYVETMLEAGESVLVFTDHVLAAEDIAKRLKGECVTGKMPAEMRTKVVEDFQAGRVKVIVATIGSLSVGVTLTAARHVVFNDLSWVPSDNKQAEGRIYRIGQKSACFTHYMIASPTDAYITKVLREKADTIGRVLG